MRAVCDRYADRFGVELPRPSCMAELYGQEFADWAYAEDEEAARLGLSVSLVPSTTGPIKTLRAPLEGDLIQVRVTDAAEDLEALLALRWPELSDEARRVLWAVTGWASPSGVAKVGDLEQLAARAGIAEPRTARLLLELAQRGALGLSGGEAEAVWLPSLLRGEVAPGPRAELAGVQRGLAALTAAVEGLASGGRLEVVTRQERYRVRVAPPRKGRDRGCWCLRVYGPGIAQAGRRELTDLDHVPRLRAQAQAMAASRERQLNGDSLTLADLFQRWREGRRGAALAKSTRSSAAKVWRWLSASRFAGLRDGELAPARVLEMREDLTTGPDRLKVGSAKLYLRILAQAWKWGHLHELVSQPWPNSLPLWRTPPRDKTRKRAYSQAELLDLLRYFEADSGGRYLPVAWLLAETGARVAAVCALRVRDVQVLEDGSARVQLGRDAERGTKTREERVAVVSPSLAQRLDLKRPGDCWLFPSPVKRGSHVHKGTIWRVVSSWARERGLFGLRDVHSLRRRGAAELHRAGVPTEVGARILGQTSPVFLSYASKADYDLSDERRRLWVAAHSWHTTEPNADASPEGGTTKVGNGFNPKHREHAGGPVVEGSPASALAHRAALRSLLSRRPAWPGALRALCATFGGGGAG